MENGYNPETAAIAEREAAEVAWNERQAELRQHYVEYLGLKKPEQAERIEFRLAAALEGEYADQFGFLDDDRLSEVAVAVIPDDIWPKSSQPSESNAASRLVAFRKSHFEGDEGDSSQPDEEPLDEAAWLSHELGHCQAYLDSPEGYEPSSEQVAFDDIDLPHYPNNPVEVEAFSRQFEYLKAKGKSRERVAELLAEEYDEDEFRFLDRVLDEVYR